MDPKHHQTLKVNSSLWCRVLGFGLRFWGLGFADCRVAQNPREPGLHFRIGASMSVRFKLLASQLYPCSGVPMGYYFLDFNV